MDLLFGSAEVSESLGTEPMRVPEPTTPFRRLPRLLALEPPAEAASVPGGPKITRKELLRCLYELRLVSRIVSSY